jgi:hypothetical protein
MKWLIVAALFMGDVPLNLKAFALDPENVKTAADCQRELDAMQKEAKALSADIWGACVEVKRDVKPQSAPRGEPGTEQNT